jgi:hypothetical protein
MGRYLLVGRWLLGTPLSRAATDDTAPQAVQILREHGGTE